MSIGLDGKLNYSRAKMVWDRDDPKSVPQMIKEDGGLQTLEACRLKHIEDRSLDFIYMDPNLESP